MTFGTSLFTPVAVGFAELWITHEKMGTAQHARPYRRFKHTGMLVIGPDHGHNLLALLERCLELSRQGRMLTQQLLKFGT